MLGELRGQVNGADLRQRGDLGPAQLRAVSRISWWDVRISVRYPSVLARTRKSCAVWPGFGCITVTDDLDAEKLRFSSSPFSVLLLLSQSPFPKLLLRLAASHLIVAVHPAASFVQLVGTATDFRCDFSRSMTFLSSWRGTRRVGTRCHRKCLLLALELIMHLLDL